MKTNKILIGAFFTLTAFSQLAFSDKKVTGEKIVTEFTNNLKDITPEVGGFSFVYCAEDLALTQLDIRLSAKMKDSIEIPILNSAGSEQKIKMGSKNVFLNFNIFTGQKMENISSLDDIDLDNISINCEKQERVIYKSELTFTSGTKPYASISYEHPKLGSINLRLGKFKGKAIKKGFDFYAAVEGVAKIETFDRATKKIKFQDLDMIFRFHYNNAGDKPIFNMDSAQLAGELKQKLNPITDIITHEEGTVEVTASHLNVRQGPSVSYQKIFVAEAGERFYMIARSGKWINIKLDPSDETSYWIHGGFVNYID